MYLQTSRLQYNLQGVVLLQTAFSKKLIRLSPCIHYITKPQTVQPHTNRCPAVNKEKEFPKWHKICAIIVVKKCEFSKSGAKTHK